MDVQNTVVTSIPADVVLKPKRRLVKKKSESGVDDSLDQKTSAHTKYSSDPDVVEVVAKLRDYTDVTDCRKSDIRSCLTKMTVPLIKAVCRSLGLRVMGKKVDLIDRVLYHYDKCIAGTELQCGFKRAIVSRWIALHGPAFYDRKSCVNDMDLMGEDIGDIPMDQIFSFQEGGFTYAFDIATFGSLIAQGYPRRAKNPYTRDEIPVEVLNDYKSLLVHSTILGRPFSVVHAPNAAPNTAPNTVAPENRTVENGTVDVHIPMSAEEIDFEISSTMYVVDSYGYYTNPDWVTGMTSASIKGFMSDMVDIFTHRANLSRNTMMRIVHPSGVLVPNPQSFSHWLRSTFDMTVLKQKASELMKKLVLSGAERSDRELGSLYMLTALTLRSHEAAVAMPWLYESAI